MKHSAFLSTSTSPRAGLNQPATVPSDAASDELIHELRQPLGVIETLAYYLELTAHDQKIIEHARQIQAMVGKANRILSGASAPAPSF
jgi:signal transduction histidine kinase